MPRTNVLHDKKSLDLNDRLKFDALNDSRITNRKRTSNYEKSPSRSVSGFEFIVIKTLLRLHIFQIGLKKYHNPIKALLGLKKMIDFRRSLNVNKLNRFIKSNGRYFFALNVPGWPSKSFDVFIDSLYARRDTVKDDNSHLLSIIFAITKKCPLRC